MSRVLLKQWSDGRGRPRVGVLDLDTNECSTEEIKRVGGVADDGLEAPNATENIWRRDVENRIEHTVGRLVGPESLDDPAVVETLKNCIALHFARGFAPHEMIRTNTPAFADGVTADVLAQYPPEDVVHALTGLHVETIDAVAVVEDLMRSRFKQELEADRFDDEVFLTNYRRAQEYLDAFALEVWYSPEPHFVIADIPVVTDGGSEERIGFLNGVPWGKATSIFMPVSPHHVVALAQTARWYAATPSNVITINRRQVRSALRQLFFVPDHGPGHEIAEALRQSAT